MRLDGSDLETAGRANDPWQKQQRQRMQKQLWEGEVENPTRKERW
jgi:hypothetical protein